MSNLSSSLEKLGDHPRGPLIAVNFSGVYPPGSAGNEFARAMVEFLRSALATTPACGVVLDLTQLDYVWGDAIGGLAIPFLAGGEVFRCAAIVATGRTARALEPLLGPNFLMGVAGMQLAETKQQALAIVEEALARGVPAAPGVAPASTRQHVAAGVRLRRKTNVFLSQLLDAFDRVDLRRVMRAAAQTLAIMTTGSSIRCRIAACPVDNTGEWDFFLINDSGAALSAVLNKISYEWGDEGHSDSVHARIDNLPPGAHERIWRDNGDGAELRMAFSLRVRLGAGKLTLLFEFPILYKKETLPLVNSLGRPGWEVVAAG